MFKKQVKPHYRLKYLNKRTNEKGEVGAAWLNEDNSISIVLSPLVVIPQSADTVLTLFPVDGSYKWKKRRLNNLPAPDTTAEPPEELEPEEPPFPPNTTPER